MISLHSITDSASKIIALRTLADELAQNPKCKTAHAITLAQIRIAEMKLETSKPKENRHE